MKKQAGFSLFEMVFAMTILALLLSISTELLVNTSKQFLKNTSQLNTDRSAAVAIQWLTRDLQEAKQAVILEPTRIRIYYPVRNPDGSYNRMVRDDVNTIEYFRARPDGTPDPEGTTLVRKPSWESPRIVCENVTELVFTSNNPSSVDVTLHVTENIGRGTVRTNMVHRAIFLRNY
jgi:prepilin-type N-terminal cleavage/methylation domain-containing protein